jgi:dolichol-phosphate mannosyltransferase
MLEDQSISETELTVVVPAHNEEENLPVLVRELESLREQSGLRISVLFVDDGSSDRTPELIRQFACERPWITGLRLTRNFGHQAAISIGLQRARGNVIGIMDADLQDRPKDLLDLYRRLHAEGADVAYAVRRSRRENFLKRIAYGTFYRLLARMSKIPIPVDSGDFCVMRSAFVERLNDLPERLRFVRGLRAWVGGKQVPVPVDRDARRAGTPQYSMAKLFRLAGDGLITFSDTPLRVASIVGFLVAGLSFIGTIVVIVWKLMGLLPEGGGVATIALAVLFLGGIQLVTIGILGEYVGRIFEEVKSRPVAMIAEEFSGSGRHD